MGAHGFILVGKVVVAPERRDELNERVLEILWRAGIRKRVTVEVAGETFEMVRRAVPDADGIVSFDWSLFDDLQPKEGTYDTTTCELRASDVLLFRVHGRAIVSIMTLLQAYSTEPCLIVHENKPCYTGRFRGMVDDLLGEEIDWPAAPGVWDGMCVVHDHPELGGVTPEEVFNASPVASLDGLKKECLIQILFDGTIREATEEDLATFDRGEVIPSSVGTRLVLRLMRREVGDASFEGWMCQLLSGDVEERSRLAETSNVSRAAIAGFSVHRPAPIMLLCYAKARDEEVFDTFGRLGVTLYRDYVSSSPQDTPVRHEGIPLPDFFEMDYLDEVWVLGVSSDGMCSEELEAGLVLWKKRYDDACMEPEGVSMEEQLARVLRLMEEAWGCRPVDVSFVDVMRAHADDDRYLRLISAMADVALEGTETVPELTPRQAIIWVLRREQGAITRRLLSTFTGIVADADLLRRLFGIGD